MSTTINSHILMKKLSYDSSGNETVNIMYPTTTTDDVIFKDFITNSKLPAGVTKLTGIINNLGKLAFLDSVTSVANATNDGEGQEISSTYIKNLSISGNEITYVKGDGTSGKISLPEQVVIGQATDTTSGITKLYTTTGTNTDGTIRQAELTTLLNNKAAKSHTHTLANITDVTATAKEVNYLSGVTSSVQTQLNAKATTTALNNHINNTTVHITAEERTKWNAKQDALTADVDYLSPTTAEDTYVKISPDGTNDLISNNKVNTVYLPDFLLGQMIYGGTLSGTTATLTSNAQSKLGTSSATITLTNNTTAITGYTDNEGIYYIASASSSFAGLDINTGDWVISTGSAWTKIDNTDSITGVKGNAESTYRTGNVNITPANIGLGNLTNNKQVKGLSSGTTANHVVTWGADGYTVKDSGFTIGKSVPSNAVFTDTVYQVFTDGTTTLTASDPTTAGLLSAVDKAKLDSIAEGANKYTLPTAALNVLGGVKTTSSVTSASGYTAVPIIDGVPYYKNTTYSAATTTKDGLLSKTDKEKLDNLSEIVLSDTNPARDCFWFDSSVQTA